MRLRVGSDQLGPAKLQRHAHPGHFGRDARGSREVVFAKSNWKGRDAEIARDILPEIRERLKFLVEVGLGYLQFGRGVPTLSGGESQRIRLGGATGVQPQRRALHSGRTDHWPARARQSSNCSRLLEKLKARGNSVVVVEHDEETMRRADYIVDLGPGAGVRAARWSRPGP